MLEDMVDGTAHHHRKPLYQKQRSAEDGSAIDARSSGVG